MITAAQIRPLRTVSDDYKQTERLKAKLAQLRQERQPFYLTTSEFDKILRWKLRQQYGRQERLRRANTDELIRGVTQLALNITHENKEYELELRIDILCALRGVGVPVASAVLALVFPHEYAVIDFRGWRQVFGPSGQRTFLTSDYKPYMREIRQLAAELGWPPQAVDLAIWEYDRRHSRGIDGQGLKQEDPQSVDSGMGEGVNMIKKRLKTWAGKSEFEYSGSVTLGTDIWYGKEFKFHVKVTGNDYNALLTDFKGQNLPLGTSHTDPPENSVGAWLQKNVTPVAIASYVGPILVAEERAARDPADGSMIQFK